MLERILADPRVRLFGNVTFGVDLHHRDLKRHYDQIVYAVGAQADRRMSIPGEDLPNSHPANIELDPASRTVVEEDGTARADLKILREYAARDRHDAPRRIVPALPGLAARAGRAPRPPHRPAGRAQRAGRRRLRRAPVQGHGPARSDRDRAGRPLHRLPDGADRGVPFDPATSTVSNIAGQVVHPSTGEAVAGEYVVGWAKRGPTGRIGNNKADAIATVEVMVADLPDLKGVRDDHRHPSRIEALLRRRGIDYTTYEGWRVLDGHELTRGASQGRPRVKVCGVPEMLEVIRRGA